VAERLELELRELGRGLSFPPEPDVAGRVAERLRAEREPLRPRLPSRRRLVLALAALAVAVAAAFAVPPVRAALLDLIGIGGVTIERVDELPPVTPSQDLQLGQPVSLAEARRSVDFPIKAADPDEWGAPDEFFLATGVPGGRVSLLYGSERRVRLLLTEFRGQTEPGLMKKLSGEGTRVDFLVVNGVDGYWISGKPHAVMFRDADGIIREDRFRLAGNVLLWVERGVTYRIEGATDRKTALEIAAGLR
jgi:hypothetical protein